MQTRRQFWNKRRKERSEREEARYWEQFDIQRRGHKVPERVCILAPGINAAKEDAYERITADYIIAVNYAALIPEYSVINWPKNKKINAWCVAEFIPSTVKWFERGCREFKGIMYFTIRTCMGGRIGIPHPWGDRFFTFRRCGTHIARESQIYDPTIEGPFHPLTTGVGIAACVAKECGAKYIELCGVDMFGNLYFDGSERGFPQLANAEIPHCTMLDSCLAYLVNRGVEIVTLSTTALEVPEQL